MLRAEHNGSVRHGTLIELLAGDLALQQLEFTDVAAGREESKKGRPDRVIPAGGVRAGNVDVHLLPHEGDALEQGPELADLHFGLNPAQLSADDPLRLPQELLGMGVNPNSKAGEGASALMVAGADVTDAGFAAAALGAALASTGATSFGTLEAGKTGLGAGEGAAAALADVLLTDFRDFHFSSRVLVSLHASACFREPPETGVARGGRPTDRL